MPSAFVSLSWAQRVTIAVLCATAAAVLVVEVFSAESVVTAAGVAVCGVLAVTALFIPRLVLPSALLSAGFSLASLALPVRLDNTFGLVELSALSWLMVHVVMARTPRRAVGSALALGAAILLLPLRLAPTEPVALIAGALALGVPFLVLLGLYLRLHERRRADGFAMARQEQRLEYARDLHDFVAHHVTAIVAQTKAVRYTTAAGSPPSPEDLDGMLAAIETAGSEALTSMRGMITVLRGDAEPPRPSTLGEVVRAAADRFPGPAVVTTSLDDRLATRVLPDIVVETVRHVVQESLTNVLRHAEDASAVEISARQDAAGVAVTVHDDGPGKPGTSPGFGLVGLAERVAAAGGVLDAGPVPTGGWRVVATLPSSGA
ncbi:sensor histidine kinase [Actinokineospora sp. NPDC004072]